VDKMNKKQTGQKPELKVGTGQDWHGGVRRRQTQTLTLAVSKMGSEGKPPSRGNTTQEKKKTS